MSLLIDHSLQHDRAFDPGPARDVRVLRFDREEQLRIDDVAIRLGRLDVSSRRR